MSKLGIESERQLVRVDCISVPHLRGERLLKVALSSHGAAPRHSSTWAVRGTMSGIRGKML